MCHIFKEKNHRFITTRVTGQTKSLYKEIWNFAYINENYLPRTKQIINPKSRPMIVIDLLTKQQTEFPSINSVEDKLKINHKTIMYQINKNNFYKNDHYKIILKELVSTIPDEL